ncbi:unnamed protein product, partial [Staurois parvus]
FCDSRVPTAHVLHFVSSLWSSPSLSVVSGHSLHCPQSLFIPCTVCSLWSFPALSAVSGHSLHCPQSLVIPCTVRSLWSSPVLCPQSLVISCTVSTVSGHLLYCFCSLWSSPVLCPQSLGHPLYFVRSLWSSPVLCPQSLVISCTVSAVSGHPLYCVCSPLVQNIFFSCFSPL